MSEQPIVVARVTKWLTASESKNMVPRGHVWWVLTQYKPEHKYWDFVAPIEPVPMHHLGYLKHGDGDKFDIVEPDDWPDWLCVEMAKRALTQ